MSAADQIRFSTDPRWVRKQLGVLDGRSQRRARSRERVLAACRELMAAGNFRPTMVNICKRASVCARTGFQAFLDVEALHLLAVSDNVTHKAVLQAVLGTDEYMMMPLRSKDRIVRAAVTGRAEA